YIFSIYIEEEEIMSYISHLECSYCGKTYNFDKVYNLCPHCSKPLLARYDLKKLRGFKPEQVFEPVRSMWRYKKLMPVLKDENIISLGEGMTPLLPAKRLGELLGLTNLYIKDESFNPTGSFKARGLSCAISKVKEFGIKEVVIPSAGNAGGATSAYSARTGIKAHIYMPEDVPQPFILECKMTGADVKLVRGLISDCGKEARKDGEENGWFDLSTLKEPYRLEGKKTMGYELAEHFSWNLPDVIIYPTGGGTGLIGMWKAFMEMAEIEWIKDKFPRMVTVQSSGCAPIVRAFQEREEFAKPWENAKTYAAGLRVPSAVGDFLMLRVLRESKGTAIAVSDEAILSAQMKISMYEGIFACPEGGATLAALEELLRIERIKREEKVVLFNTATGLKYPI
ncbi:MAG: threonine synthase, partial [Candidatus Aminicenantia bacterium]